IEDLRAYWIYGYCLSVNVTRALGERRHIGNTRDAGSPSEAFVVQEKESLVPQDRTAQRSTKLVQAQWRVGNAEKVACVERVVAKKLVGRSMQRIGPGFGYQINDRPAVTPVFR